MPTSDRDLIFFWVVTYKWDVERINAFGINIDDEVRARVEKPGTLDIYYVPDYQSYRTVIQIIGGERYSISTEDALLGHRERRRIELALKYK